MLVFVALLWVLVLNCKSTYLVYGVIYENKAND